MHRVMLPLALASVAALTTLGAESAVASAP